MAASYLVVESSVELFLVLFPARIDLFIGDQLVRVGLDLKRATIMFHSRDLSLVQDELQKAALTFSLYDFPSN